MQPNIESTDLTEFIKFGQTGVLNEDGLSAIGSLLETLRSRVAEIADYRENGAEPLKWDSYTANEETVTLDGCGFEVQMENYDRCDSRSYYSTAYVSFGDVLDPNVIEKIKEERRKKAEEQKRKEAARKAAAKRKADAEAEEKAAFARFKEWEKANGNS